MELVPFSLRSATVSFKLFELEAAGTFTMADTAATTPSSAPASTPKAKKTAKAGAAGSKRPRVKPAHPPTADMVNAAIAGLKERGGSSLQAIKKYIAANYKADSEKLAPFIKKYLKSAVASGTLTQPKGKGAAGSFKISVKGEGKAAPAKKAAKPKKAAKKPAAEKKPKPASASKKASAAAKSKSPKAKKVSKPPTKKPKSPKPKKAAVKKAAKSPKKAAPKKK